jgi:septation ring formation regulator EzrA
MKNLEKVLLVIVTILIIALIAMTVAFFNMRKNAEDNLQELLNSKKQMTELKEKLNAQGINID